MFRHLDNLINVEKTTGIEKVQHSTQDAHAPWENLQRRIHRLLTCGIFINEHMHTVLTAQLYAGLSGCLEAVSRAGLYRDYQ